MPETLIIAYGNPLRCDDGVAWRAAEELSLNLPDDVEIITCHQLTPELASIVSQASLVVFVDAAREGIPGEITSAQLKPRRQPSIFTHDFSPVAILNAAAELYGKCPEAFCVSIAGQDFDHGETLSAKVSENLPRLISCIEKLVRPIDVAATSRPRP